MAKRISKTEAEDSITSKSGEIYSYGSMLELLYIVRTGRPGKRYYHYPNGRVEVRYTFKYKPKRRY